VLPLLSAAPVPAPLSVPVPGFPLEATVPASPPTIPVLVPFFVTSSPVPGAMTGPVEAGTDVLAAGVEGGGAGAGVGAGAVAAGVVVDVFRSLHAPSESATRAAAIGTANLLFIVVSPSFRTTLLGPLSAGTRKASGPRPPSKAQRLAANNNREPRNRG